jgi:radical SAM protein with 4Fe4S-binding SPASM domain
MRSARRWQYFKDGFKIFADVAVKDSYDFDYDLMPCHCSKMSAAKRLNLLKAGVNLLYWNPHPWSWPVHMHVELTNYCNLCCQVCPTGTGNMKRKPQAMDPALFERLMDEAGPYLLTASLWGWGEPLLHPGITDILRLQHNRGINTFLSTNGQNLDDGRVLQALIEYPPTYLIVCLDGITDETNAKFRVGAKMAPALYGVRELSRLKRARHSRFPILHHRFIAMKHNEHELNELPDFSKRSQFDMLTVRTLSIIDTPDNSFTRFKPADTDLCAYEYRNYTRVTRRDFICEKAFIFPAVLVDGRVIACEQDYNGQLMLGDLAEGSTFGEIWHSQRARGIRKIIRDKPESLSFCRNCPFKDRPVTDCSIKRYDLQNNSLLPPKSDT